MSYIRHMSYVNNKSYVKLYDVLHKLCKLYEHFYEPLKRKHLFHNIMMNLRHQKYKNEIHSIVNFLHSISFYN